VPELPEVETARALIADHALHRRIVDVDDTDTYVCRPHRPGEIRAALLGRRLTAAHRRGKTMWCETSGRRGGTQPGPDLGLHLGMAGRIVVSGSGDDDAPVYGGGPARRHKVVKPEWDRFTLTFDDGGTLRLFDTRRLSRVRLDPDVDALGPDGLEIGLAEFRERVGRGTAPVKARLLDQSVVAGIGNLLADQLLWEAYVSPRHRCDELTRDQLTALHKATKHSLRVATKKGGVHTGEFIEYRKAGAHCPRCGTEVRHATVGSRSTWWCPEEQV
jgi:formamidopyrimidine-DNA glycosylase